MRGLMFGRPVTSSQGFQAVARVLLSQQLSVERAWLEDKTQEKESIVFSGLLCGDHVTLLSVQPCPIM